MTNAAQRTISCIFFIIEYTRYFPESIPFKIIINRAKPGNCLYLKPFLQIDRLCQAIVDIQQEDARKKNRDNHK
jgi:hypothetical protein